jgi:hypothetical protein
MLSNALLGLNAVRVREDGYGAGVPRLHHLPLPASYNDIALTWLRHFICWQALNGGSAQSTWEAYRRQPDPTGGHYGTSQYLLHLVSKHGHLS